jgi:hypothetical protein
MTKTRQAKKTARSQFLSSLLVIGLTWELLCISGSWRLLFFPHSYIWETVMITGGFPFIAHIFAFIKSVEEVKDFKTKNYKQDIYKIIMFFSFKFFAVAGLCNLSITILVKLLET